MKSPKSPKDKISFLNLSIPIQNLEPKLKELEKNSEKESSKVVNISRREQEEKQKKVIESKVQIIQRKTKEIIIPEKNITPEKNSDFFFKAILNIITLITTNLSFFFIQILNLAFLGHTDNLVNINAAQLGTMYLNTCGYIFCLGAMHAFDWIGAQNYAVKKFDKLYKVYNHNKIFTLLLYLIIMLPLGFTSKHMLGFLRINSELINPSSTYIQICLISLIISLYNDINYKFLLIMKKDSLVLFLNLIGLNLHLINCLCFIFTFNLGIIGAGITMIVTSCQNFILSTYFLLKNNPCEGKSLIEMDTDSLISSRFYMYAKLAFTSGIFKSIEVIAFDFIILASVYLDYTSMTSNIIILNYISIVRIFSSGIANLLTQHIESYFANVKKEINSIYIKYETIIGCVMTVIISALTFFFAYNIPQIFVDDIEVIENVGFILKWYSIFIFFDTAYHFINGAIKGIQKHSMINLVCSLILILIFIPLGLLFTFAFGYGYLGFWISSFFSMFFYSFLFGGYFYYLLEEHDDNKVKGNTDIDLFENLLK